MESQSRFSSLSVLFGAIIKIADSSPKPNRTSPTDLIPAQLEPDISLEPSAVGYQTPITDQVRPAAKSMKSKLETAEEEEEKFSKDVAPVEKLLLTDILPDPGYFAAGAVAGVVSRTSTAPLDRLKVYLIANIGPAKDSVNAIKKGDAVGVAKTVGRPLIDATKELWKAGGMRSLFAGK